MISTKAHTEPKKLELKIDNTHILLTFFSPIRLYTSYCAGSDHDMPVSSVLCHLSRHLLPGHIVFHQVSPSQLWSASISFSVYRYLQYLSRGIIYLAFAHVRTISASSLWGIPPSGTRVPLSRCLHFSRDLVSSFLLPTAACVFQLCATPSPISF